MTEFDNEGERLLFDEMVRSRNAGLPKRRTRSVPAVSQTATAPHETRAARGTGAQPHSPEGNGPVAGARAHRTEGDGAQDVARSERRPDAARRARR